MPEYRCRIETLLPVKMLMPDLLVSWHSGIPPFTYAPGLLIACLLSQKKLLCVLCRN
jgi:hypothetical protein